MDAAGQREFEQTVRGMHDAWPASCCAGCAFTTSALLDAAIPPGAGRAAAPFLSPDTSRASMSPADRGASRSPPLPGGIAAGATGNANHWRARSFSRIVRRSLSSGRVQGDELCFGTQEWCGPLGQLLEEESRHSASAEVVKAHPARRDRDADHLVVHSRGRSARTPLPLRRPSTSWQRRGIPVPRRRRPRLWTAREIERARACAGCVS